MVIIKNNELNLDSAFDKAFRLIGKNKPIISLYRNQRYNDEPQFFQYSAIIRKSLSLSDIKEEEKDDVVGGTAISKDRAIMKALGEAIERYCLARFKKKDLTYAAVDQLRENYLNPLSVVNFSTNQLKNENLKAFCLCDEAKLSWIKGHSLTANKSIFIPAQLVYVPYHNHAEPIIRLPITTGAAAGSSIEDAVKRGICEIVERDSFMIFYLNKLMPLRLDLSETSDKSLTKFQESFERYNLDLYVFDISTDLPFVSIMAIIIDNTGIGPAVSVGLKCSLFAKDAIIGAIEEAQQIRSGIRDNMYNQVKPIVFDSVLDLKQRGLYWSKLDSIKDVDFFLNSRKIIPVDKFIKRKSNIININFDDLVKSLKAKNLEVMFVDVTRPEIRKQGFFVVKVIIPGLQPLYLYEDFKYLGGERLYQVPKILGYRNTPRNESELNNKPHPFL